MVSPIRYRAFSHNYLGFLKALDWLYFVSLFVLLVTIPSFAAPTTASPGAGNFSNAADDKYSLHRLDFRLEGKSCAACLLAIQRKLNSLPGVKEAVVMLKRPYGVSVVYQASQMKADEILSIIKEKEPNIKIFEISDTITDGIPAPLIPPFVPVTDSSN